jgi:arylsulfatase A-like enzyme
MGYYCVRTPQWKYIEYQELKDAAELYDLQRDPYELHNAIAEREAQPMLIKLRARLRQLLESSTASGPRR